MDSLFTDLIGKPTLSSPKIITVVAENFSLLEDQSRFLKATLAIPEVKQLPLRGKSAKLIQIGPLPIDIEEQVRKANWAIEVFDNFETSESVCDRIEESVRSYTSKNILFLNDASRLELSSNDPKEPKKLIALVDKLKRELEHSVVVIYQNSTPDNTSKLLRDLQYISDGVSRVHSCKAGYFSYIWYQKAVCTASMLLPMKVETYYHTCKIGKFYWSKDLLCFYESKKVVKNYDLNTDTYLDPPDETNTNGQPEYSVAKLNESMRSSGLHDFDDDDDQNERNSTLPFTAAQDPQQSRIFYYPDKEDDIDEDDPDNDLVI